MSAMRITHTEIYLLAALLHESCRQLVAEGKTLAHSMGLQTDFAEWPRLHPRVHDGRRRTAELLLRRYVIGEPLPDLGTDPVGDADLASSIHECEREAVEAGDVVVNFDRGWVPFSDLPDVAREGRLMQARYLKERAFFMPR